MTKKNNIRDRRKVLSRFFNNCAKAHIFKRTYVCSIMFRRSEYEAVRKRRTDTSTAIQLSDSARVFTPRHMRHRNAYPKKKQNKRL